MWGVWLAVALAAVALLALLRLLSNSRERKDDQFTRLLEQRVDPATYRPPPPPIPMRLPPRDADEGEGEAPPYGTGLGIALGIDYVDAAGAASRRRITILKADDGYLRSWCHERGAYRTFRRDRIQVLFDPATGEILSTDWLSERLAQGQAAGAARRQRAAELRRESRRMAAEADERRRVRDRWLRPALDRVQDGADLLIYLARSDGEVHEAEGQVIRDYLRARCAKYKALRMLSPAQTDELAQECLGRWPTPDMARAAIGRLAAEKQGAHRRLVIELAERMILVDGEVHEAEQRFMAALKAWQLAMAEG